MMKKTWQQRLKGRPSLPELLRLEKGLLCYRAAHEISLAWRLCGQTRTLLCLHKR